MNEEQYLVVKNLSKQIKNEKVLDDINLSLNKGKIYGFRGKNGSGKTMLFRAICGLIKPTEGCVQINGKVLGEELSFPESVGVLIEYPGFLPNLSGYENLELISKICNKIDSVQIKKVIRDVGLDPEDKKKFKKYSLGMKQRLGIAQALMEDPDLIILDEPTNALDSEAVLAIKELLAEKKKANKMILISSHDKEELEFLSDEIFYLENGKIVKSEILKGNTL